MADRFSVEAVISAVDKGFSSTLDRLQSKLGRFSDYSKKTDAAVSSSFGRTFSAMALANVATSALSGLVGGFSSIVSEASSASDAMDKFKATLSFAGKTGEETQRASAFVKQYADSTVYDLSDVANTTAQLAANGISNFTALTEAAGNLNAVSGGNRETFKSVAMALTQTAGAGKLTTENWNQLANAIPGASGKLQEAMLKNGAYTGNFREAMAKGEITAEEFSQAILDLGMSDVARQAATSTATIEGAIGNLQANVVSKVMELVDLIGKDNITSAISSVGNVIGSVIDSVGKVAVFVKDNWSSIAPVVAGVTGAFVAFKAVMTFDAIVAGLLAFKGALSLAGAASKAFGLALSFLGGPIGLIVIAVGAVVGVVLYLWNTNEGFRNAVISIWSAIKSAFVSAWSFIADAWSGAKLFFSSLWESIKSSALSFVSWIKGIWSGITSSVSFMVSSVISFFNSLWSQALVIWSAIVNSISSVLNAYFPIFSAIWDGFRDALEIIWNLIKGLVETSINFVKGIIEAVMLALSGDWQGAWDKVKETVGTAWENIKTLVADAINALWKNIEQVWNNILNTVSGIVSSILGVVSDTWNSIVNRISSFMGDIFSYISDGWNRVTSFLDGINLFSAGGAIIQSFLDGLMNVWNSVKGFVSGIANWIRENKGPIRYDRKLLIPAGQAIMGGFNNALSNGFREVQSNVSSMGTRLQSEFGVTSSLNAKVETNSQPVHINVSLAGREFETLVDDITNLQNRKESIRLKYV